MINFAPSRASSDSIFCGSSTIPFESSLVDARLYLRRRRYGASHGVGLLHRLAGLEGTYAVALTAPRAYLQQSLDATQPEAKYRGASKGGPELTPSARPHRLVEEGIHPRACRLLLAVVRGGCER